MTRRIKRVVTTLMAAALILTSIFSASTVAFASNKETVNQFFSSKVAPTKKPKKARKSTNHSIKETRKSRK